MLAFTMLWAYVNFSQFLIIWSGNLRRGDPLVPARACTGAGRSMALVPGGVPLRVPFLLLLSRDLKRNARSAGHDRGLDPARAAARRPLSGSSVPNLAGPRREGGVTPAYCLDLAAAPRGRRAVALGLFGAAQGPAAPARSSPRPARSWRGSWPPTAPRTERRADHAASRTPRSEHPDVRCSRRRTSAPSAIVREVRLVAFIAVTSAVDAASCCYALLRRMQRREARAAVSRPT